MISVACSKLTKRLRKQIFEALIYKDMSFYDQEENNLNSLLTLLRYDARIVPLVRFFTYFVIFTCPKFYFKNNL